ncbi:MAG: hypothetical protein JEZ04_21125 [Spirochaetales bacterium]|nr:hypothetical protein [Spirochaetales bacterium]
MTNTSFHNNKNEKEHRPAAKNFELWDLERTPDETNKELEFYSQCGKVKIRLKQIDRDLVPDGFLQAL